MIAHISFFLATGIWAIDFAEAYPSAEVIGTDLSPIQPTFVPPNARFEIDDATDEWTWKENFFDYIHIRMLYGSIDDWPRLYKQAYDHLQPGGWIEQLEIPVEFKTDDGSADENHIITRWGKWFLKTGDISGRTFRIIDQARDHIEKVPNFLFFSVSLFLASSSCVRGGFQLGRGVFCGVGGGEGLSC